MNTQRKVVITTTYNEMGIIIDTKVEEVAQPDTTTYDSIPAETGKNDGDGTSGDCISRQQAIDTAIDAVDNWDGGCNKHREQIIRGALEILPTVQPERKKSKWVQDDIASNVFRCSECGCDAPVDPTAGCEIKSNFCPNCGAMMDGGEQDGR